MSVFYSNAQIRQLEQFAIQAGISAYELMQTAGQAAFDLIEQHFVEASRIAVICGAGNNAGDGFEVARLAQLNGLHVTVHLMRDPSSYKGPAKQALKAMQEANVETVLFDPTAKLEVDLAVDAILGSGLVGEVSEEFAKAIEFVNHLNCPVLSLDVPSGLDVDTGSMQGCAVQAEMTITFIGYKQGLFTRKGPGHCGNLLCHDLHIPSEVFQQVEPAGEILSWNEIRTWLPKRDRDANKGDYGHVLVIGGDYGMGGAVRMAAEAAMRVGAGLVTVATRPEHVGVVSGSRPEIMCCEVQHVNDLEPLLKRATFIVIGPGLGKTDWAKALLERVLQSEQPKLLDADALNLLSQNPSKRNDWILTPHPGEAGRLLDQSCQRVQENRFNSISALEKKYGGVIVLKGVGTLIQGKDAKTFLCKAGNPGMTSGGMGDVLSGVIGGLAVQGLSLQHAAQAGVFIHAHAGDRAAQEGGERGLLATDLLVHLRHFVNPDRLF